MKKSKKRKPTTKLYYTNQNHIDEIYEFFKELYIPTLYKETDKEKRNDCWVRLYNIGTKQAYMYPVWKLLNKAYLNDVLKRVDRKNLAITMNNFSTCKGNNKDSNLHIVKTLVIDIDFKNTEYTNVNQILYFLEEDYFNQGLPVPNYLEIGNQLRLIYILKEPIYLAKNSRAFKDFINFVMQFFANKLKEFGAEPQAIHTYLRVPHSINTKNKEMNEVILHKYSDYQYIFQEIVDEFLPDLPDWYKPKAERTLLKKKRHFKSIHRHNQLLLKDFEKLQAYFNKIELKGHRELLNYLYRNHCLLLGRSQKQALEQMLHFNQQWKVPIEEHKITVATNNVNKKMYKYTNKTLIQLFDLDDELINELGLEAIHSGSTKYTKEERKLYNHEYYKKHREHPRKLLRSELTQKIKRIVLHEKKRMKTNKAIQTYLSYYCKIKLSIKSIERYVHMLIIEGLYSPI